MSDFHYFASDFLCWECSTDLEKVKKTMVRHNKRNKGFFKSCYFTVYKVPLPITAHYEIDEYRPVVKGIEKIGRFDY
jgi:hypothetical protein